LPKRERGKKVRIICFIKKHKQILFEKKFFRLREVQRSMSSMLAGSGGNNAAFARKNTFSLP